MACANIENPMMDFDDLVKSVNNPDGQPMQDIAIETSARSDGGQVGGPGQSGRDGGNGGSSGGNGGNGGSSGGNGGNNENGGNGGNGQGQISPDNSGSGSQQAIGGAAEVICASIWGAIMVSTTAVIFTTMVW